MAVLDINGVASSLLILSLLAIALNSFCLHLIRTRKAFGSKPSTVFLINLLLTHLFQAMVVLPMYVGKSFKPTDLFSKRFFKNGFLFTYLLSFYGVCSGVLLISVDRFLATYLLTKYKVYVTLRNALFAVLGTWMYTLILCLIPFIPKSTRDAIYQNKSNVPLRKSELMINATVSTQTNWKGAKPQVYFYSPQAEWTVFMLFVNAALPFVLIVLCYIYVVRRIRVMEVTQQNYKKQNQENEQTPMKPSAETPTQKLKGFRKYKEITYFALTLSAIYFMLWTPSIVYYTILRMCEKGCFPSQWDGSKSEKYIVFVIKFLSYCNGLVSPVFYCLRHPEIKKSVRGFLGLSEAPSTTATDTSFGVANTQV